MKRAASGCVFFVMLVSAAACNSVSNTDGPGDGRTDDEAIVPFTIDVPEPVLTDLRDRLADARFPDELEGAGWTYGTNLAYVKELVGYWQD